MAGIGFELRKIFNKGGILRTIEGAAYASAVTVGPVVMVITTLLLMYNVFHFADVAYTERELLSATILYCFIFSLVVISLVDAMLSRSIADAIYGNVIHRVMAIYRLGLMLVLPIGSALGLGFGWRMLTVGGLDPVYVLFSYLLFMSLILVFYAMIYMSAIKEYKFIALAYLLGMVLALVCSLIMIFGFQIARYRAILYSYSIGFMFIAAFLNMLVHRYYPRKAVGYRQIFRELWHNKALALTNFCYILGLYISNFIVWNSSIRVVVANVFVNAPPYDMATCLAMFSNITAMIIFVVQVETNFHERHQHFCEMLMGGSKKAIDTSKRIVFRTLWQQVLYMAELQLIITVINFLIAMVTLRLLGFGGLTLTFYPTLTVSFYATFLMYAAIVSLYYFDDKFGSLLASVTFLVVSAVGTVFMVFYVDRYEYYGMGMLIGAVAGWIVTFLRLNYLEHHIDTYIFCKGYLIPREKGSRPKSLVYHK